MPAQAVVIFEDFAGLAGGLDGQSPTVNTTNTHWTALVDDNLEIDGSSNGIGPHDGGTKPIDTLDVGATDYVVSVELSGQGGTSGVAGAIVFRSIDANNHYRFSLDSAGTATLKRITAGTPTTLATYTVSFAHGTRYGLMVSLGGTSAVLSIDGVKLGTITGLTQGTSSTLVGLWSDNRLGAEVPTFNNFGVDTNPRVITGTPDFAPVLSGTHDAAPILAGTFDAN